MLTVMCNVFNVTLLPDVPAVFLPQEQEVILADGLGSWAPGIKSVSAFTSACIKHIKPSKC